MGSGKVPNVFSGNVRTICGGVPPSRMVRGIRACETSLRKKWELQFLKIAVVGELFAMREVSCSSNDLPYIGDAFWPALAHKGDTSNAAPVKRKSFFSFSHFLNQQNREFFVVRIWWHGKHEWGNATSWKLAWSPTKTASEFIEAMCDNRPGDFILFLLVSVRVDWMSNLVFVCGLVDIFHIAWMPQWVVVLGICDGTSYVILILLEHCFLRLFVHGNVQKSPKGSYTVS